MKRKTAASVATITALAVLPTTDIAAAQASPTSQPVASAAAKKKKKKVKKRAPALAPVTRSS